MARARWLALAGTLVVSVGCGSSENNRRTTCTPRVPIDETYPSNLADWCQVSLQQGRSDAARQRRRSPSPSPRRSSRTGRPSAAPFTSRRGPRPPMTRRPRSASRTERCSPRASGSARTRETRRFPSSGWRPGCSGKTGGAWNYMAYRWNDAGTEAVAEPGGEVRGALDRRRRRRHPAPLTTWSRAQLQCEQCHAESGAVGPIGPKARLLEHGSDLRRQRGEPARPLVAHRHSHRGARTRPVRRNCPLRRTPTRGPWSSARGRTWRSTVASATTPPATRGSAASTCSRR